MSLSQKNIDPSNLRAFIKARGWVALPQAINDGLYVFTNPEFAKRQLVIPVNSDVPDYEDAVEKTLEKLSELINQPVPNIITSLHELNDDSIKFRVIEPRNEDRFIPLNYAVDAINGAKDLFLAAACSVIKPLAHHPRLTKSEALQLLEASRFRHTEKGSFVLKVSCPIKALEEQGNLYDGSVPFVRQTVLAINNGLSKLVNAIQSDNLENLVGEIKAGAKPDISSNLCNAILNFRDKHDEFDLFLDFSWANILPLQSNLNIKDVIKIQKDYFARIEDVRQELRNTAENKNKEEVFMASVERLAGEIDENNLRLGARESKVLTCYFGSFWAFGLFFAF